jgi:hypothetical protein
MNARRRWFTGERTPTPRSGQHGPAVVLGWHQTCQAQAIFGAPLVFVRRVHDFLVASAGEKPVTAVSLHSPAELKR